MACPAIVTGSGFLGTMLAHIDCQAQTIGSYGYGALADPGSTVSLALSGLLTVFIALFGIRLLLGVPIAGRDVVGDVIKLGLVLTLATSWPAWRIIGYDLVMDGPEQVSRTIGASSGLVGGGRTLRTRLQNADDGLVSITMFGTGRLTGGVVGGSDLGDSFHGIALADETGLGWGRVLFLASTIGPYAIVRLGAGILLAIAPLMAGLALFGGTIGLFAGWVRGLAFSIVAGIVLNLVQAVELAILDPWITDVLAHRDSKLFTPSAPTELIVMALAFCALNAGGLFLAARVVFQPHFAGARVQVHAGSDRLRQASQAGFAELEHKRHEEAPTRAHTIADAVATSMRRQEAGGFMALAMRGDRTEERQAGGQQPVVAVGQVGSSEVLGSGFRRSHRRASAAGERRDVKA